MPHLMATVSFLTVSPNTPGQDTNVDIELKQIEMLFGLTSNEVENTPDP